MKTVESIEESARKFVAEQYGDKEWDNVIKKTICYNTFIAAVHSDAARNHWEEKLNNSKFIGILS